MQNHKSKKRRCWQFNVSTLILLTTLVAIAIGWWFDHKRMTETQKRAEAAARLNLANLEYDLRVKERDVRKLESELRMNEATAEVYLQRINELLGKLPPE